MLVRDLCKSEQAEGLPMEAVSGDGKYKNSHWIFLLLVLLPEFVVTNYTDFSPSISLLQ